MPLYPLTNHTSPCAVACVDAGRQGTNPIRVDIFSLCDGTTYPQMRYCGVQMASDTFNHARNGSSNATCDCRRPDLIETHRIEIEGSISDSPKHPRYGSLSLSAYLALITKTDNLTESAKKGLYWGLEANKADAIFVNIGLWWWYVFC